MTVTQTSPIQILAWVDEVPAPAMGPYSRNGVYDDLIAQLKANPDQWALVGDGLTGVPATSVEHLKKKGLAAKTRTDHEAGLDAKGHKLVRVFAGYFPNDIPS